MAWFCHHHRHRLPMHQREFIADTLLGYGFNDGRITSWQLEELRSIVRSLTAAPARWA
jgi:hypothetical protein